jgi:hypothetical protein
MALKISPGSVPPEKTPPVAPKEWKDMFPSGSSPVVSAAKDCEHIWNPQTNRCVRCGEVRPGATPGPEFAKPAPKSMAQPEQSIAPTVGKLKLGGGGQVLAKTASQVQLPEPTPTPWRLPQAVQEPPAGSYTVLHAIQDLQKGRPGILMLVKKASGEGYKVERVFESGQLTATVQLSASGGLSFKTRFGLREVPQYDPVWRS